VKRKACVCGSFMKQMGMKVLEGGAHPGAAEKTVEEHAQNAGRPFKDGA